MFPHMPGPLSFLTDRGRLARKEKKLKSSTAVAHPNIALIKYWGNRDHNLRLPSNGSISMTLAGLETQTTVEFDSHLSGDLLRINGKEASQNAADRVSAHLDHIRDLAGIPHYAKVTSSSNFPIAAGIASSSSAFAALTLAAAHSAGLDLDVQTLSRIARLGSGSASRSIFGGFVEWDAGTGDDDSFSQPLASGEDWKLTDLIALVDPSEKPYGSTQGHKFAESSPLQAARVADTPRRLALCREAIENKDFNLLGKIVELDSNLMHSVMQTSTPALRYWTPETVRIMQSVELWRSEKLEVCYTIDAGPNVHCLCTSSSVSEVKTRLKKVPGVQMVLTCNPGTAAHLL